MTKITFGVLKILFGVIEFTFGDSILTYYIGCQSPVPSMCEACARGALLILAPWGLDGDTDYARFHRLNDLAAEICATTDVSLLDMNNLK